MDNYRRGVEFVDAVRRRHMTRHFSGEPIDGDVVDRLLDLATRAPSAGYTQGLDLVVLSAEHARSAFWRAASSAAWRDRQGVESVLHAPVVIAPVVDPSAYLRRYGEPDKHHSGLAGIPAQSWPVPYWSIDAAFAVMTILLAASDAGLGALFFRLHGPAGEVLAALGAPTDRVMIGAIGLGHPAHSVPDGSPVRRPRRVPEDVVHRERW